MRIYLVQHGEAISEEVNPERPLSEKGILDVKKVAQFLRERKIHPDAVWHSTKLRAIQTAEIILEETGVPAKREKCEGLAPNDAIDKMVEKIKSHSLRSPHHSLRSPPLQKVETGGLDEKDMVLMIVGHLPYLQKLSDHLLTGSQTDHIIAFRQGGVVCLEEKQGKWQLRWQIIPELL